MGQEYYWQAQFTYNGKQYNTPMCREFSFWYTWRQTFNMYTTPVWWLQSIGHVVLDVGHYWLWWFSFVLQRAKKQRWIAIISLSIIFLRWQFLREWFVCRCSCMLHVIDGEKKREKEEERRKKEEKIIYFLLILRPIFVGGACGGLYGRGALAPPHNPFRPHEIST